MLTLNFKIVPKTLVSDLGFNHLLSFMLTLEFKIVPKTLVSDLVGVNHLLMSMPTFNFGIKLTELVQKLQQEGKKPFTSHMVTFLFFHHS